MNDSSSQSNSQSFNDSELSKGYHLLTESSHTVKVNTRAVPLNMVHLYPRLAGSDWTCYISQPSVILGRSGTVVTTPNTRQKQNQPKQQTTQPQVDVDFGSSKAVSRKHCEVKFSYKRDRWELYVFGRNGIKINHIVKKPRDRPTVLKTGALIEIDNTSFVFILPDNYIKPIEGGIQDWEETNTPNSNDVEDIALDHELEVAMIDIMEKRSCMDTKEIMEELKKTYAKPVEKENILHLLVLSSRFHLAPNSISMSFKESDSVKWMLIPLPVNMLSNSQPTIATKDNDYSIHAEKSADDMSITTPSTNPINTPSLEKGKTPVMSLASTDDMSITSTPALAKEGLPFGKSRDDMSISTPNNLMQVSFMRIDSIHDREQPGTPNVSFSRFFDGEECWSVFIPEDPSAAGSNDKEHEQNEQEADKTDTHEANDDTPNIPTPAPTLFRGMSMESMYSVWSHSTSFVRDPMDNDIDEVRPTKRLRQAESTDNMSIDGSATPKETSQATKEVDIFRKLRTEIVYTA